MIDEAIGKILGMAMAYGVSALGMFLAYVNYRRRVVKADRVMTPAAWGVLAATVLVIVGGVVVVRQMAEAPSVEEAATVSQEKETATAPALDEAPASPAPGAEEPRERWPMVGILLPALVFLFATWITGALFRHFSRPASPDAT